MKVKPPKALGIETHRDLGRKMKVAYLSLVDAYVILTNTYGSKGEIEKLSRAAMVSLRELRSKMDNQASIDLPGESDMTLNNLYYGQPNAADVGKSTKTP